MPKKPKITRIEIADGAEEEEVIFCDNVVETRIGETFYITGLQLRPQEKMQALNGEKNKIKPLKVVSLCFSKETFKQFIITNKEFIEELTKQGILDDDSNS